MNLSLRYLRDRVEYRCRVDNLAHWAARHLPASVAYWAFIRVAVHGINEYPGDRRVVDALDTWPYPPLRSIQGAQQ